MSEIKITINGKLCSGENTETILEIAERNGIEIPTLCHNESVKHYGACGVCLVEAEGNPKLLRSCSTLATDGMVINTEGERARTARKIALELLLSDHDGDCRGACVLNCPAGTDCQSYIKKIAQGDYYEAVKIMKDKLPIPASIGRVCPHPCETACRRKLVEEPLSIAYLKYFAADKDLASDNKFMPEVAPATGKKVAVIGGGPGGLTAAYFLRVKGHDVEILEAMPKCGGMLRYGIPEYRLPKAVLDAEIKSIEELGVKITTNFKIGRDASFADIRKNYDAVIVAIGAWHSSPIGCPGEELAGVWGGIDMLKEVALANPVAFSTQPAVGTSTPGTPAPDAPAFSSLPSLGDNVVIVGGGNTAMDCCRSAVRLGCKNVYVVYRRTQAEMPANAEEIQQAMEEGVKFCFLRNPAEIIGEGGKVKAVKLQVMELGQPDASGRRSPVPVEGKFETLAVDSVIAAIGQKVAVAGFEELELNKRGIIAADESTFRTNLEGVFAVGDATNKGADIAIAAIGEAGKAAAVIDSYLMGAVVGYKKPYFSERNVTAEMLADEPRLARHLMPVRSPEDRKKDFKEMNLGFSEADAIAEAKRCLECGCHDYYECSLIKHARACDVDPHRFDGDKRQHASETKLEIIERDAGKCILCNLCVRVCTEVAGQGLLGLVGRGFTTVIKPEFNDPAKIAVCKTCGKCAAACPTGALKLLK